MRMVKHNLHTSVKQTKMLHGKHKMFINSGIFQLQRFAY